MQVADALHGVDDALTAKLVQMAPVHAAHQRGDGLAIHTCDVFAGQPEFQALEQFHPLTGVNLAQEIFAHGADQTAYRAQVLHVVKIACAEDVERSLRVPTADVAGLKLADGVQHLSAKSLDVPEVHGGESMTHIFAGEHCRVEVRRAKVDSGNHLGHQAAAKLFIVLPAEGTHESAQLFAKFFKFSGESLCVKIGWRPAWADAAFTEEGVLEKGECLVFRYTQKVFLGEIVDRVLDESLVKPPDILNVKLAESPGPLPALEIKLLAGQPVVEQFEYHVFAQLLETLEVQLMDLFKKLVRRKSSEISGVEVAKELGCSLGFVAPLAEEIFKVTAKVHKRAAHGGELAEVARLEVMDVEQASEVPGLELIRREQRV